MIENEFFKVVINKKFMVKKYRKGYFAEWSLAHELHNLGYAVVRTPRSGRIGLPSPDIIAAKSGKIIVIECKARESGFKIPMEQLNELKEWKRKAKAKAYIAWKLSRKKWLFLSLKDVLKNKGNVGKKLLLRKGISISEL